MLFSTKATSDSSCLPSEGMTCWRLGQFQKGYTHLHCFVDRKVQISNEVRGAKRKIWQELLYPTGVERRQ
jgi:hypothetical protein